METLLLMSDRIITQSRTMSGGVLVRDGRIEAVLSEPPLDSAHRVVDCTGFIVAPGFLDLHVHGCQGDDVMDADVESLRRISKFLVTTGTTSFVPTTLTASHSDTLAALNSVRRAMMEPAPDGAHVLGAHLEGPYIHPDAVGAQNPVHVRFPSSAELSEYERMMEGSLRIVTLAPELEGSLDVIRMCHERGIAVSVGHSRGSYGAALRAIDAGLSHATHLFNAMGPLHHKDPGMAGAAILDERMTLDVIADLVHVHPAALMLLTRAKPLHQICLITDSMRATGMPDGVYDLGGIDVVVTGGVARTPAGGMAGSTLRMIDAVRNMTQGCQIALSDAVHMASWNPARVIGCAHRKGSIAEGKDADFVVFDDDFKVVKTFVAGQMVFQAGTSGL